MLIRSASMKVHGERSLANVPPPLHADSFGYDVQAMEAFIQGWGLTIASCAFIVLVFFAGWLHVHRELAWLKALTDYLGDELVSDAGVKPKSLEQQALRDEAHAILTAKDAAWAQKQVRSWQMRSYRLEPALAFW